MRLQETLTAGLERASRSLSGLGQYVSSHAQRQLDGVAGSIAPTAAPSPIRDLLLDEGLYTAIDSAVARIGLVVHRSAAADGEGAAFHRLPTQTGPAALIRIDGEILGDRNRAEEVGLVAPLLRKQVVTSVFVLTDAKQIEGTYKYKLWPSWKAKFFKDVVSFDATFLELLESQNVEERLETLCDNFQLERDPPATVRIEPGDHGRVVQLLLGQAVDAVNPGRFLRGLVDKLYVDNVAKGEIVGKLGVGDLNQACQALIDWAARKSYPQDHEMGSYTVIGALFQALHADSGVEQRLYLTELVERYGLIRDRQILAQLRANGGEN